MSDIGEEGTLVAEANTVSLLSNAEINQQIATAKRYPRSLDLFTKRAIDMATMDAFNPGWRTDTAGPAQQWSRLEGDPLRFFIWPKAPAAAQTLDVKYVRNPIVLALTEPITEVPAAYMPALADYVIYRAESADDEHTLSGRAAAHRDAFYAKAKG